MRTRELGPWPDAYDDPTFGKAVESGDGVRQRERVPEQWQQDRGTECDTRRCAGNGGEQGQRLAARTREQRIADPHRVVPGLFCPPRRPDDVAQVTVRPQQNLTGRKQKPGFGLLDHQTIGSIR